MGKPIAPRPMNPMSICGWTLPGVPCRVMADRLLFVTQVAPYHDGPAGVHGVLDQAAVGVGQVAELHGLSPERVDDVRALSVDTVLDARALALFTIGETPWSAQQQRTI